MKSELRSGKFIGYLFAIPCSIVVFIFIRLATGQWTLIFPAIPFVLGAYVGVSLILSPKTLVCLNGNYLELYSGSLLANKKQIKVPVNEIEDYDVKSITDGEGSTSILFLYLRSEISLSHKAQRWINSNVPKATRENATNTTLLWNLSWPEGGIEGARNKMTELIGRAN